MTIDVTAVDFFCGAGGTTTAAKLAGIRVIAAANHWKRAIETHNTNHPEVDHYLGDISEASMRAFPKADILFASPECKTHSPARGRKPERTLFDDSPPGLDEIERSRATMRDVVRYAEHHEPAIVVVENVVEILRWGPKHSPGADFQAWLKAMLALDYLHRPVFLNSMVAWPTPQSRDRIYIVFWKRQNRAPDLEIRPKCWCTKCDRVVDGVQSWKRPDRPWGKYRTQYVYRCPTCAALALPFAYPAATAIDWSLPAPRIGDRKRELAPATIARIRAGLERFAPPFFVKNYGNAAEAKYRPHPVTSPLGAITAEDSHALVVDTGYDENGPRARSVLEAFNKALVVPLRAHGRAAPAERVPWPTIAAGGEHQGLLVPCGGTWNEDTTPTDRPMRARTTRETEALLVPPFVMVNRTHNVPTSIDEPLAPVCTGDHHYLVEPPAFVLRNNKGGAEMATGVDEPLRTLTSRGHQSLVTMPFLVPYNRTGQPWPVVDPMGTVDTRDRRALVMPEVEVEDCGFRMLASHEIGRAMGFADDYIVLGNNREKVRQYGNAVTPPVSPFIAEPCVQALAGREV